MPMTDEQAAAQAIATFNTLTLTQQDAKAQISTLLASEDPFIDIHTLLSLYNPLYFRSLLHPPRVEVSWSPRLTLCAGICERVRDPENDNKFTRIRLKLSEPLLKFRPRSDVLNTLLHEAIHAYLFITTSWRHSRGEDESEEDPGHGTGFMLLADAINHHGGYDITVHHKFHDEVDSYRTHIWQCDGPCQSQAPRFGQVKRVMNRPPGERDDWWAKHLEECGGVFVKVSEPKASKAQMARLSGLRRAGMQGNKIDGWVVKARVGGDGGKAGDGKRVREGDEAFDGVVKRVRESVECPICGQGVAEDVINEHLDQVHPP